MSAVHILPTAEMTFLMSKHPELSFGVDPNGIALLQIDTALAQATMSLQGAQVLHFQVHGEGPLLWQGVAECFRPGKALRAGAPICWPWFSSHPTTNLPTHGFARNRLWELREVLTLSDQSLQLTFGLDAAAPEWPVGGQVRFVVTIGRCLELELQTTNLGSDPLTLSQALHTYFHVGDVRRASIRGLSDCPYFEGGALQPIAVEEDILSNFEAIERIYIHPRGSCELIDPVLNRRILIASSGCQSTVVWNPGAERARVMGDLGPDGFVHMLCIEAANAPIANDAVTIAAGASHSLSVNYRAVST